MLIYRIDFDFIPTTFAVQIYERRCAEPSDDIRVLYSTSVCAPNSLIIPPKNFFVAFASEAAKGIVLCAVLHTTKLNCFILYGMKTIVCSFDI